MTVGHAKNERAPPQSVEQGKPRVSVHQRRDNAGVGLIVARKQWERLATKRVTGAARRAHPPGGAAGWPRLWPRRMDVLLETLLPGFSLFAGGRRPAGRLSPLEVWPPPQLRPSPRRKGYLPVLRLAGRCSLPFFVSLPPLPYD